jgi:hypothetical protein
MLLGMNINVSMDHKNRMFDTLKMQCVLGWCTKIKEFSPMLNYIMGPRIILAGNLSRLHRLVTPAQIAEGKKPVARFLMRKKTKNISWIKNTLVFMMRTYRNVLIVISIYLTLHIRMSIR